jgi:hypothetical protein
VAILNIWYYIWSLKVVVKTFWEEERMKKIVLLLIAASALTLVIYKMNRSGYPQEIKDAQQHFTVVQKGLERQVELLTPACQLPSRSPEDAQKSLDQCIYKMRDVTATVNSLNAQLISANHILISLHMKNEAFASAQQWFTWRYHSATNKVRALHELASARQREAKILLSDKP